MPTELSARDVQLALVDAGVYPEDAIAAAADPRLEWSEYRLEGCLDWIDAYSGDIPAGVILGTKYLRHGFFPPMAPPVDPNRCPAYPLVCTHGDLRICHGLHGYAAKLAAEAAQAEQLAPVEHVEEVAV